MKQQRQYGHLLSLALAVAALSAGAADRYDWTGAAGDNLFLTGGNWAFGGVAQTNPPPEDSAEFIPGNNSVRIEAPDEELVAAGRITLGCSSNTYRTPAKLTIGPGNYSFFRLNVGADADIKTAAINATGELVIEEGANVTVKNADPLRVALSLTNLVDGVESSVYVKGGLLALTGGNVQFGWESRGNLYQTGGVVSNVSWFSIGRAPNGSGFYDLAGGTFKHYNATEGVLVGEEGRGIMTVRGTGVADVLGKVAIGDGVVNIEEGGLFKVSAFRSRVAGNPSVLNLNGGTLQMQGNTLRRDLVNDLQQVNMLAGGVTIDVPTGYRWDVRQPILGNETSGGLVKTGPGTLFLVDGNTYQGVTEVREGTLLLASPTSIDQSKLVVLPGASVGVDSSGWDSEELKAFIDGVTGDLPLDVVAGETLVIDFPIGNNVANVIKTGGGTLILSGANAFTGRFYLREGLVQADRGTGIPAEANIVFEGGTLAPQTESVDGTLGTEGATLDVSNGPLGFTAVGHDLTVRVNEGEALLSDVEGNFPKGSLILNAAEATHPLTFLNPLQLGREDLSVQVDATAPEAVVTLAGGVFLDEADTNVTNMGRWFYKRGEGTLKFTGEAPYKLPGHTLSLAGGTTIFEGEGHEGGLTQLFDCNGKVILTNASYKTTGQFLVGQGAGFKGEAYLYNSTLDLASWLAVGRHNGGAGYMRIDNSDVRVRADSVTIGNTAPGVIEQNGGDFKIDVGTIWLGEDQNYANYFGDGRYVLNGGTLTSGTADPCLTAGNYGRGAMVVNGGTLTLPKRTYLGRQAVAEAIGTFELHGGTVNSVGEFRTGYRSANNTFVMDGGEFNESAGFLTAYEVGAGGSFQMKGGVFNASALFSLGRNGLSTSELSGGTLNIFGGDNFVLGRYSSGTGDFTVSGGQLICHASTKNTYIGQEGTGTLTVTGDGYASFSNNVYIAYSTTAVGELRLGGNGVVEAKNFNFRKGTRRLSANGGTIRVVDGSSGNFFVNAADAVGKDLTSSYFGPGGLTFDVGANDVRLGELNLDPASEGTLRKTGSGTLTLEQLPVSKGGLAVLEGQLRLATNVATGDGLGEDATLPTVEPNVFPEEADEAVVANNYLARRMTFDGTLEDAVTGNQGTIVGQAMAGAQSYTLPGGNDQYAYLDLGKDYLPKAAYATLELWLTVQVSNNNWSKIFSFGSSQADNWMLGCTGGTTGEPTATIDGANVTFTVPGGGNWAWTNGKKYHVSCVITPNAENADLCSAEWMIRDALTGKVEAKALTTTARSLLSLGQEHCWLGRSEWPDMVPGVSYHELRVWEAALSQSQLAANVRLGEDVIPTLKETAPVLKGLNAIDLAEGTTLNLNGNTVGNVGLAGSGTVLGPGSLVITEDLTPNGTLTINGDVKLTGRLVAGAGDKVIVNGTLDVTGADAIYTGPAKFAEIVTIGEEGQIKGQFGSYSTASETFMVVAEPDRVVVRSKGTALIVR